MGLNGKYTEINEIMERIHRDYGFSDINKDEVAEWIWDIVGLIGACEPYVDTPAVITIEDFRGKLPADMYSILSVRDTTNYIELRPTVDNYHLSDDKSAYAYVELDADIDPATGIAYNTTVYSDSYPEYYVYKLQGNYIYVGYETGEVEMMYKKFPVNLDTGLPLIPDDPKYIAAVVAFCATKIAFKMLLKDLLTERKYNIIEQQSLFASGAARNKALIPDPHKMETIRNMWKSPYPYYEHFDTGNVDMGKRDR